MSPVVYGWRGPTLRLVVTPVSGLRWRRSTLRLVVTPVSATVAETTGRESYKDLDLCLRGHQITGVCKLVFT